MPLGLHLPDLLVILAIALLFFGPKKLPEIGASIGKSISSFKKGMRELKENMQDEPTDKDIQDLLKQRRSELKALEHEISNKKASTRASNTSQVVHAEAISTDLKLD
jgi:sec-independent protein translocase protein TatA